jgi:hypothetical protein
MPPLYPRDAIALQVTVPIAGAAVSLRSLLPGAVVTQIGLREVIGFKINPITTAIELQTTANTTGIQIPPGVIHEFYDRAPMEQTFFASTTAGTVSVGILLLMASSS